MGENPVFMSTATAARYLGVGAGTLRDYRRRRIGPSYVRYPSRDGQHDRIVYPLKGLQEFVDRLTVQAGRLPRPHAGRMPGVKNARQGRKQTAW
jgi:hypothetical protein